MMDIMGEKEIIGGALKNGFPIPSTYGTSANMGV
jgi:hypothetical protein